MSRTHDKEDGNCSESLPQSILLSTVSDRRINVDQKRMREERSTGLFGGGELEEEEGVWPMHTVSTTVVKIVGTA